MKTKPTKGAFGGKRKNNGIKIINQNGWMANRGKPTPPPGFRRKRGGK